MDFSSVKEITIPEGAVSKIVNSSGAVLWEGGIAFTVHTSLRDYTVTVPKGSTWQSVTSTNIDAEEGAYIFYARSDLGVDFVWYDHTDDGVYDGKLTLNGVSVKLDDEIIEGETYIADESFNFHVETRNILSLFTVPRGSTWRDAAAIYNTSVGVNNRYKFVIVEDDLWGDSVVIEYYYSGTRSETILDVKPDDVINQPYYSTF